MKELITRTIRNTWNALNQNKKWTITLTALFSLLYLFATGAVNRYSYIPDWAPYAPTIFSPAHEYFELHAFVWRFTEHWLLSIGIEHFTGLVVISALFAANVALLLSSWKRKKIRSGETMTCSSGIFASFFTVSACCSPALAVTLFGASIGLALEAYHGLIQGAAILLLVLTIFLLNRKK